MTIHSIFAAILHLFGILWPALGAAIVAGGICLTIAALRALWAACNPARPQEWSDWES